ncbi:MAG: hypothetical protein ABIH37_05535 [archaeon]
MKRSVKISSLVIISLILINLFAIPVLIAQSENGEEDSSAVDSAVSNLPGIDQASKIVGGLGEINPRTGFPKQIEDFQRNADYFIKGQNQSFMFKNLMVSLSRNPIFFPFMFYINIIFSLFNPIWQISFGMSFSFTWSFFFAFGIWVFIVTAVYYPLRGVAAFNEKKWAALVVSVIIAMLTGMFGIINRFIIYLDPFVQNILVFILIVVFGIILDKLWITFVKSRADAASKEELEKADDYRMAAGEASRKFLKSTK